MIHRRFDSISRPSEFRWSLNAHSNDYVMLQSIIVQARVIAYSNRINQTLRSTDSGQTNPHGLGVRVGGKVKVRLWLGLELICGLISIEGWVVHNYIIFTLLFRNVVVTIILSGRFMFRLTACLYVKPRTDEQFFLDNFSLTSFICSCVRLTIFPWQAIHLNKEPGLKAGHASFSTRKLVRVYGRQGKIVRRTHEKINLSRNLSRKNCSSVRGLKVSFNFIVRENSAGSLCVARI